MSEHTPCRFGYEEYDGARYCHEHAGFLEAGVQSRLCDRAPRPLPLHRTEAGYRAMVAHQAAVLVELGISR